MLVVNGVQQRTMGGLRARRERAGALIQYIARASEARGCRLWKALKRAGETFHQHGPVCPLRDTQMMNNNSGGI